MPWEIFDRAASSYEDWYTTRRGQRASQAERALLDWLLALFPEAQSLIEVGCGTGHFTGWLSLRPLRVLGLDRAPAMLAEMRRHYPGIPTVLGDAHHLPFHEGAADLVVFVTTLEFLNDPEAVLAKAVRVARLGFVVVALNRWSLGGLSRRWGTQAHQPLLGQARDCMVSSLVAMMKKATNGRCLDLHWASTLFPNGLWKIRGPIPFGDVIGIAVRLVPRPCRAYRGCQVKIDPVLSQKNSKFL